MIKSPKLYFTDTGLAAYLLGLNKPAHIARDPLLGNLFENIVVTEALKARNNMGKDPDLYFYTRQHTASHEQAVITPPGICRISNQPKRNVRYLF